MRALLVLGLLAAGGSASADSSVPTSVRGRLAGTSARLTARFVLDVSEGSVARDMLQVELPPRAVVTGAIARADGVTRRLALLPAADAKQQFDDIAEGADEGDDRTWAVHVEAPARGSMFADVTSPRATHLELDVELEADTCFYRDARYVELPIAWASAIAPDLAVANRNAELVAHCDGTEGAWIAFPDRALAAKPAGPARIGAHGARLPLPDRDLARIELAISRELGAVPADLQTAIVVDASRSLTDGQRDAQRAVIAAYLRAAPHGQVQVIAFARDAHALLADWADATAAAPQIDRALAELQPRNGSNLDAALAEAGAWLARTRGTRRVIAFDDELVPSRLASADHAALASALPAGTLVHVVALDGAGSAPLERYDDAKYGELAQATLGMAVRASASSIDAATLDATMLARPISLDHIELQGDWYALSATYDCMSTAALAEGTSCTWTLAGDASSGDIVMRGRVWGRPFARTVHPDPDDARSLARVLAATGELEADVQAEVDRAAEAVNSAWSLFVRWGGNGGYAESEEVGFGSSGTGSYGSSSHCGGMIVGQLEPMIDLAPQLRHVVERCSAQYAHVELELELTREEIVDVSATVTGTTATPAMRDCIVEAAWQTMLAIPNAPAHDTKRVVFD